MSFLKKWEFAKEVCEKLKFYYKATQVFSGTKYPTADTCFINMCVCVIFHYAMF